MPLAAPLHHARAWGGGGELGVSASPQGGRPLNGHCGAVAGGVCVRARLGSAPLAAVSGGGEGWWAGG